MTTNTKAKTNDTETWESPAATITTTVLHDPTATSEPTETTEDSAPLVGQELLDLVNTSGDDISREDLIKTAGYTKVAKDGTTRLMYAMFMEALLEAQGTKIGVKTTTPSSGARMGHPLSYATRVHFNGNIMVGKAYVSMLPHHDKGQEFKVVVDPENNPGGINLVPVID
jgi:hypothetical protein